MREGELQRLHKTSKKYVLEVPLVRGTDLDAFPVPAEPDKTVVERDVGGKAVIRIVGSEVIARTGNSKSRVDYYGQSWIVKPI